MKKMLLTYVTIKLALLCFVINIFGMDIEKNIFLIQPITCTNNGFCPTMQFPFFSNPNLKDIGTLKNLPEYKEFINHVGKTIGNALTHISYCDDRLPSEISLLKGFKSCKINHGYENISKKFVHGHVIISSDIIKEKISEKILNQLFYENKSFDVMIQYTVENINQNIVHFPALIISNPYPNTYSDADKKKINDSSNDRHKMLQFVFFVIIGLWFGSL